MELILLIVSYPTQEKLIIYLILNQINLINYFAQCQYYNYSLRELYQWKRNL